MADAVKKAVSTIGTILEFSTDGTAWSKLCSIKSYPALGGSPEQIETTDLEDEVQTLVPITRWKPIKQLRQKKARLDTIA